MSFSRWMLGATVLVSGSAALLVAQQAAAPAPAADDPVKTLVERLELEQYKAHVKGLTQFGDRREGTQRNRDAVTWIEAQLKSYGCTNTERIKYEVPPPAARGGGAGGRGGAAAAGDAGATGGTGAQGAAGRGAAGTAAAGTAGAAGAAGAQGGGRGAAGAAGGGQRGAGGGQTAAAGPGKRAGQGGSTIYGYPARTGVNNDPMAQPDEKIREMDMGPVLPAPFEEVYCTKVGTTHPEEMYIVGGHMDGIGYGQAANDDGSGSAVVMELARVFSGADVQTERSIRFALWNGEEGGLHGANAYVTQRQSLQGKESPAGSGKYPEPKWLGMIQHDMMMWDHGAPRPDGTISREQRPEADVNVEFQDSATKAADAMALAWLFKKANEKYATDYPVTVGPHMTNTDSGPFQNIVGAISLRENERGAQIGGGWDPNWHQPTDVYTTYYDKDFRLGLNAAQTTLAAIAQLTGAKIKK